MKITNSVEKNGYPQLIQDCNASTIEEISERVLHPITGKFDSAYQRNAKTRRCKDAKNEMPLLSASF